MPNPENSPAVSEVSICNLALGWLGQSRITSLSDHSRTAELCNENYGITRNAVIEERMWTFAKVRAKSITETRDGWGEMFVHDKPLDWLQVFEVFDLPNTTTQSEDWLMEEGKVLAMNGTVYMRGVIQVTNTNRFSYLFVKALANRIAATLCMPITQDAQMAAYYWTLYQATLADAATRDGQQGANTTIKHHRLIRARRGY